MAPQSKKRRLSGVEAQAAAKRRQATSLQEGDRGEGDESNAFEEHIDELDMVNIDDDRKLEEFRNKQREDQIKQQNHEKAEKPVKLSDFQCIICLDSPTDLTVTHCGELLPVVACLLFPKLTNIGHLFCSLCLHEALHAGTQRKTCPVCRQQISVTKTRDNKQPKTGVFPLELKLMTARRKGKQPEGDRR
jgi:hypothetical protein